MRVIGDPSVGRVTIQFEVANNDDLVRVRHGILSPEKVRRITIEGVVDSGAAKFVLPKSVADQLGLIPSMKVRVRYAGGRTRLRAMASGAHVTILGREGDFTAIVEPKRKDALISAIVLEDLDLLVDCTNTRVIPRDPRIQTFEIE